MSGLAHGYPEVHTKCSCVPETLNTARKTHATATMSSAELLFMRDSILLTDGTRLALMAMLRSENYM